MSEISSKLVSVNNLNLVRISVQTNREYDKLSIGFSNVDAIQATTEGTIKEKEVLIIRFVKTIDIYVLASEKKIALSLAYYSKTDEYEEIEIDNPNYQASASSCSPLTIFTAGKKFESFDKRINKKILPEWNVELSHFTEDVFIKIKGNKKSTLVCFGEVGKIVTSSDLSFVLEHDTEQLVLPWNFVVSRFRGKTVALHVLVKPDFQKKVKNLYYKSQISNEIFIPDENLELKQLFDFQCPTGRFDPMKWIVNYNYQIPEFFE